MRVPEVSLTHLNRMLVKMQDRQLDERGSQWISNNEFPSDDSASADMWPLHTCGVPMSILVVPLVRVSLFLRKQS